MIYLKKFESADEYQLEYRLNLKNYKDLYLEPIAKDILTYDQSL